MASSAVQTGGFVDPYAFTAKAPQLAGQPWLNQPNSISANVGEFLGTSNVNLRYKQAQTDDNRAYERESINSARAWEKYLQDTQVQRSVEDIKKAGLNPWLAVQSGVHSSGSSSADTGGSAQNMTSSQQSKSLLSTLLMSLAMIMRPVVFKKP